jgi:hypothetical protein
VRIWFGFVWVLQPHSVEKPEYHVGRKRTSSMLRNVGEGGRGAGDRLNTLRGSQNRHTMAGVMFK